MSLRALLCLVGLAVAVVLPLLAPNYLVNVGMMVFFIAFIGQSWNVAGGFAGGSADGSLGAISMAMRLSERFRRCPFTSGGG